MRQKKTGCLLQLAKAPNTILLRQFKSLANKNQGNIVSSHARLNPFSYPVFSRPTNKYVATGYESASSHISIPYSLSSFRLWSHVTPHLARPVILHILQPHRHTSGGHHATQRRKSRELGHSSLHPLHGENLL